MDELKLNQQKEKGAKAQSILDDEVFQEAAKAVSEEYFNQWVNTSINDVTGRENLWRALKSLDKVVKHLRIVAQNGRLATKDIAEVKYLKR